LGTCAPARPFPVKLAGFYVLAVMATVLTVIILSVLKRIELAARNGAAPRPEAGAEGRKGN